MTTIQSLLKPFSLKQLIPVISQLRKAQPLPFYLLKVQQKPLPSAFSQTAIAINRGISNDFLRRSTQILSIWSPHHMERLCVSTMTRFENQVILKNPYKSEQLIKLALKTGIKNMVIDCLQEYHKIQQVRSFNPIWKNKPIKYIWAVSEHPQSFQQLSKIKNKVSALTFDIQDNFSRQKIDSITRSVLQLGCQIQKVICSGEIQQIQKLKQWQRQTLNYQGIIIQKTIEVTNYSDVDNYVLATRTLNRESTVIDTQAQQLLQGVQYDKDCLLVSCQKQDWLISKISKMPLDEQPYIYHLQKKSGAQERQMSEIISVDLN